MWGNFQVQISHVLYLSSTLSLCWLKVRSKPIPPTSTPPHHQHTPAPHPPPQDRQTGRQTDRETDRKEAIETDRQTGRHRDRQTDRQTDSQTHQEKEGEDSNQ